MRAGSKKKVMPSSGLGAKPTEPETIESMIASPRARAVASTAAATIAGRAARSPTVRRARQRLTPSAAAPSVQLRGTERSASMVIATMIGVIITVSTRTPTSMLEPSSWITYRTDSFSASEITWLPKKGTRTRIPIRP